ncbi:MAG: beta-ketoacyl synthase chain length factor [Candidatus Omnitrophica bacterium]|nr:beta-ketoacyl synthase chain length factor [Candidatus Omnitrophota bacterium]
MYIHGIGIISSVGRGLEAHRAALTNGQETKSSDGVHRVSEVALKDPALAKDARRAGRFDRMAILAGLDALKDAGPQSTAHSSSIGLILATGLGPHVTTFRFLDDMISFKEKDVSPTLFSHSVHNAAASYLSLLAGIRGPTLTVTRFSSAFQEALTLAQAWLEQKRCDYVLVGAVDELGSVMEEVLRFRASGENIAFGEGSAFFVLSQHPSEKNYEAIESVQNATDITLSSDQLVLTERLFGRLPCQSAFRAAVAALLLSAPKTGGEI